MSLRRLLQFCLSEGRRPGSSDPETQATDIVQVGYSSKDWSEAHASARNEIGEYGGGSRLGLPKEGEQAKFDGRQMCYMRQPNSIVHKHNLFPGRSLAVLREVRNVR